MLRKLAGFMYSRWGLRVRWETQLPWTFFYERPRFGNSWFYLYRWMLVIGPLEIIRDAPPWRHWNVPNLPPLEM
jgi:hypothetical protein